ncbi:MAG: GNAT family N-acetyltransferase [Granulosicoccus sp.]
MIRISTEPTPEELRKLDERLEEYNAQRTGIVDSRAIGFTVYDTEVLIGGLNGVTSFGWLYIETLWLDEAHRHSGIGSQLLLAAEKEALSRGCQQSCLSSFSFQAKPFYEQHGYEVFGQLDDYPAGENLYFMRKNLNDV